MTDLARRDLLISSLAAATAASLGAAPGMSFAASHSDNGLTITIGGRKIEIIIPFFPEMPPKDIGLEIPMDIRSNGRSTRRTAKVNARAFMAFASALEGGGKVDYSAGGREFSAKYNAAQMGRVTGRITAPNGDEGTVESEMAAAAGAAAVLTPGAAVAIVAIVAVVAVVAILAGSGGGSVEAKADTPVGSAEVEVEVGGGSS